MASLAAYPSMMQRDRNREGLRVSRAAWLIGVTVREYLEIEAGERMPSPDVYGRICELSGVAADVRRGRRDLSREAGRRDAFLPGWK